MELPKILVVPGSNRSGSHNVRLAGTATKVLAAKDCEVTWISLRDYELPIYDGDLEHINGPPENAFKLARMFHEHQGVLIVSPEYNSSVPPLVKNTLDWISRISKDKLGVVTPYRNTVFALASCSLGGLGGIRNLIHLRSVLVSVGAGLVISEQIAVGDATKAFGENDNLSEASTSEMLDKLCQSLIAKSSLLARV